MSAIEKSAVLSGNTKSERTVLKARHYLLTLNEKVLIYYDNIKNYLLNRKTLNYFLAVEHLGTSHQHYHIYIQFTTTTSLNIKKLFGSHIDLCRGTPQSCKNYLLCKDEKHIKKGVSALIINEEGEIRTTGGRSIKEIKEMSRVEREDLDIKYFNIVNKINQEEDKEINIKDWHKDVKVIYICGPSGSGKSQLAKRLIESHTEEKINIVKHVNDFWEGVGKSKVCLYDEFRPSHMKASEFINFIDYNKHIMNVKGGEVRNNYETIIITSIFKPDEIYTNLNEEDKKQWLRRIKIIDLYPKIENEELNILI